jgi:hypothetical protein
MTEGPVCSGGIEHHLPPCMKLKCNTQAISSPASPQGPLQNRGSCSTGRQEVCFSRHFTTAYPPLPLLLSLAKFATCTNAIKHQVCNAGSFHSVLFVNSAQMGTSSLQCCIGLPAWDLLRRQAVLQRTDIGVFPVWAGLCLIYTCGAEQAAHFWSEMYLVGMRGSPVSHASSPKPV